MLGIIICEVIFIIYDICTIKCHISPIKSNIPTEKMCIYYRINLYLLLTSLNLIHRHTPISATNKILFLKNFIQYFKNNSSHWLYFLNRRKAIEVPGSIVQKD